VSGTEKERSYNKEGKIRSLQKEIISDAVKRHILTSGSKRKRKKKRKERPGSIREEG